MTTIKFNHEIEFRISTFSKTTYFSNANITSTGNCTVISNDTQALINLGNIAITSIEIYNDEVKIYDLSDIHAKIDNYVEQLNDGRIERALNITFSNT